MSGYINLGKQNKICFFKIYLYTVLSMIVLNCEERGKGQSLSEIRKSGKIPGVFYGHKQKSTPVSVKVSEFLEVWKKAGESGVVTLRLGAEEHDSLIYDVDRDPVTERPRHADFYVFEKGQKLKVKVPVGFVGVAPAIKDMGGVLVKVLHELEVEAPPKDLPRQIEVNISLLIDFQSQILARDIELPSGVELITKADDVVASVYEPKEEKVVEEAPPDLTAIEVEKKGKEVKEGEEGTIASAVAPGVPAETKKESPAKK